MIDSLRTLTLPRKVTPGSDLAWSDSPQGLVKSFHHHCAVWKSQFGWQLRLNHRQPLDKLFQLADDLLNRSESSLSGRGSWKGWDQEFGLKSKRIQELAATALESVNKLPPAPADPQVRRLQIQSYTTNRVLNPPSSAELVEDADGICRNDFSWFSLREELVLACGRFGHVGPDDPLCPSPPDFWVVEDRYNEERYHYLEIHNAQSATAEWLSAISKLLLRFSGWGVGVGNLRQSYLLIFSNRLMVSGNELSQCTTLEEVVNSLRKLIVNR